MKKNGRPKGSKDAKKRLERESFTTAQIREIESMRDAGMPISQICEKMNRSTSWIKQIVKKWKMKPNFHNGLLSKNNELDIDSKEIISGIYVISIYGNGTMPKYYIGSSTNIISRIKEHYRLLTTNRHYNTEMQNAFNSRCSVKWHKYMDCDEQDLLRIESEIISQYCRGSLLNTWSHNTTEEMLPILDRASERINENNYTITSNGCWEWHRCNKQGYGTEIKIECKNDMNVAKDKYYLKPHRVSYYKATGEYPELIRHKCSNKRCVNPEHLESGSHRENNLDTHKDKWELFKTKWGEFNGDYEKLTDFFGYKANYTSASGKKYYRHIPGLCKKLGLLR